MTHPSTAAPTPTPPNLSSHVIEGVPPLTWGTGQDCTFVGALAAALCPTDHPFSYSDLMGFTGLAFRTRWWIAKGKIRWCPSCAVGEMGEEIALASEATGWPIHTRILEERKDLTPFFPEIAESIDAGRPVLAYDQSLNMGVVYGHAPDDDGAGPRVYHRVYHAADHASPEPDLRPVSRLGWMWCFLGQHRPPAPRPASVLKSIQTAVCNWNRHIGSAGPGDYWYGDSAYARWILDIDAADTFTDAERQKLFFVSWWNFCTLADARRAAAKFLRANLEHLPASARPAANTAAKLFERQTALLDETLHRRDAFLGPWSHKTIADWTPEVRAREQHLLTTARRTDAEAIASLASIL